MESGDYEVEVVVELQRQFRNADVFVNVGANYGYYLCLALHEHKPVIGFEPLATNLRVLYQNVAANENGTHVEVYPVAVSNKCGLTKFYGSGTGASLTAGFNGLSRKSVAVPVNTLDNAIGQRFQGKRIVLLIDAEGAEVEILDGASFLLNNNPRPTWLVEVSFEEGGRVNSAALETFRVFWQCGYEAWSLGKGLDPVRRPVTEDQVRRCIAGELSALPQELFLFTPTRT
jgi:FkbM family methyltransferase